MTPIFHANWEYPMNLVIPVHISQELLRVQVKVYGRMDGPTAGGRQRQCPVSLVGQGGQGVKLKIYLFSSFIPQT